MTQPYFAIRDKGRRRPTNQDQALAEPIPGGTLLAVADGVGGNAGGDVASAETMKVLHAAFTGGAELEPLTQLPAALNDANRRVRAIAEHDPALSGLATTVVAAIVKDGTAYIASIGDSRAYLLDGDGLRQLTEDDSWVAEQVRQGLLSEADAERSAYRNVITRGIGVEEELHLEDVHVVELTPESILLLCSDGLFRAVSEPDIERTLPSGEPSEVAQRLVDMANEAGGPDNISVALYHTWFALPHQR